LLWLFWRWDLANYLHAGLELWSSQVGRITSAIFFSKALITSTQLFTFYLTFCLSPLVC
jgi:hypothetical protein